MKMFLCFHEIFPVISTIKYHDKSSWTGTDIYNEAPCPCPVYIWYRIHLGACYIIIIPGSSMDPVSREYFCDRDSLQSSAIPHAQPGYDPPVQQAGHHNSSLFYPTQKIPDNFKNPDGELLLPILGGLRNSLNTSIYLWPSKNLDYLDNIQ